jgi:hypothetical protein
MDAINRNVGARLLVLIGLADSEGTPPTAHYLTPDVTMEGGGVEILNRPQCIKGSIP